MSASANQNKRTANECARRYTLRTVYHITGRNVKHNGKNEMEYPGKTVYDNSIRQKQRPRRCRPGTGAETRQI
ncbi:MAG TPA: hypothetical protein DCZ91_22795 [Lachnospiraceae bacterium]|nr:hypothetical protein [Lachnospiraceae bacterium]